MKLIAVFAFYCLIIQNYAKNIEQSSNLLKSSAECVAGQKYPHPTYCQKYIICSYGVSLEMVCAPNLYFDPDKQECNLDGYIHCQKPPTTSYPTTNTLPNTLPNTKSTTISTITTTEKAPVTESPNDVNCTNDEKYYEHPTDCSKYIQCGKSIENQCDENLYWNQQMQFCDWACNVICHYDISTPEPPVTQGPVENYCENGEVFHAHPTDCKKFFQCANGYPHEMNCPQNLYWNQENLTCEYQLDASCQNSSTTMEPPTAIPPIIECIEDQPYYPHPERCDQYIICSFGIPSIIDCPIGTSWNQDLLACNSNNAFNCQNSSVTMEPPTQKPPIIECVEDQPYYPHPERCDQYIICSMGIPNVIDCPLGTSWSQHLLTCDKNNEINCQNSNTTMEPSTPKPPIIECIEGQMYYPHPERCDQFIQCSWGTPYIMNCPLGTFWSQELLTCNFENEVNCQSTITTTEPPTPTPPICPITECVEGQIYYPHPEKCDQYIECSMDIPYIKDCPPGTSWNQGLLTCNDHHELNCQKSNTTMEPPTQNPPIIECVGEQIYYPHPERCDQFIQCSWGIPNIIDCPPGTSWSQEYLSCNYENEVNCQITTTTTETPTPTPTPPICPITQCVEGQIYYPHPERCDQYIECSVEIPYIKDCPPGTSWNQDLLTCNDHNELNCQKSNTTMEPPTQKPPIIECVGEQIYYPHPERCDQFIQCSWGIPNIIDCPPGTSWSQEYLSCNYENEVNCQITTTTTETPTPTPTPPICPITQCVEGQIYYPHPERCDQYIECSVEIPYIKDCPPGTSWNQDLLTCNDHNELNCQKSNTTMEPPTQKPPIIECVGEQIYYPHPERCDQFIQCSWGIPNIIDCPSGTSWSQEDLSCNYENEVNCQITTTTTETPTPTPTPPICPITQCVEGQIYYPHPERCDQYIECSVEIPYIKDCPPGTSWNQDLLTCNDHNELNCQKSNTTVEPPTPKPPITECVGEQIYYPHPERCDQFIQCSWGIPYIIDCPSGTSWSQEHLSCNYENEVNCQSTTTTTETPPPTPTPPICPITQCVEGQIYYPHPERCDQYIECSVEIPYIKDCPPGTSWNQDLLTCNDHNELNCQKSNTTMEPPTPKPPITECVGEQIYYPHPERCDQFIQCSWGIPYIIDCPAGTSWSQEHLSCNYENEVNCQSTTTTTETPPPTPTPPICPITQCVEGQIYYPHPERCDQYIECSVEIPYIKDCPPGTSWNQDLLTCNDHNELNCQKSNTTMEPPTPKPPITECVGEQIYYPHPERCDQFIQCSWGIPYIIDCPSGTSWSQEHLSCNYENEVNCQSTTTTTETPPPTPTPPICPITECVEDQIYYPHPERCDQYIECSVEIPYIKDCPPGTSWNQDLLTCNDHNELNCQKSNTTMEPPTPKPPITECVGEQIYYPHPERCDQFIQCSWGIPYIIDCPSGTSWSQEHLSCNYENEVNCQNTAICIDGDGYYPHPNNCEQFIHCLSGTVVELNCEPNLYWNQEKQFCDASCHSNCEKNIDPSLLNICVEQNEYYSHPDECEMFIECINGIPHVMKCAMGLAWNEVNQSCDMDNTQCLSVYH